MNPRTVVRLALLLLAAGAAWLSQQGRAAPVEAPAPGVPVDLPAAASSPAAAHPELGFKDRSHLAEHYQKHGAEFGRVSIEEYLRAAQSLRDRPAGGDILESVRADGVVTRFDRASGAFLAFDRSGVIRTFFRPNDGEAYYQRQLKRGHSVP
jgi:pyocin large subunit-like protein